MKFCFLKNDKVLNAMQSYHPNASVQTFFEKQCFTLKIWIFLSNSSLEFQLDLNKKKYIKMVFHLKNSKNIHVSNIEKLR